LPDELKNLALDNIRTLLETLREYTLPLVAMKEGKPYPKRCASGFLIERNTKYYVLSAAHAICKDQWYIEWDVFKDHKHPGIQIPLRSTWSIFASINTTSSKVEAVDFAWAEIDTDKIREQVKKDDMLQGMKLTLPLYKGPMNEAPDQNMPYSFHAMTQPTIEEHPTALILERKSAYETEMEYRGKDEKTGLYKFHLARPHQGHKYYKGASGAPIADPTGKIVSMVCRGSKKTNEIFGIALPEYERMIGKEPAL